MSYRRCIFLTLLSLCLPRFTVSEEAPVTSFDLLLAVVEDAPAPERPAKIVDYLAAAGPTPLIEGEDALFLAEGTADQPPRILGDLNAWGRASGDFDESAGTMISIEGTDWYYLRERFHPEARIEYAIARGEELSIDPHNPSTVLGFGRMHSELAMPGYRHPPELIEDASLPKGEVLELDFESQILGNSRKVHVYLPPGYQRSDRHYPTIYIGDGTAYVERGVPRILDYLITKGLSRPVIAIFVDPVDRRTEYRMNVDYRRFLVEELVTFVDGTYRTQAEPGRRAVAGGSRGGLAAIDLAYFHPEVFGLSAAMAPATTGTNISELIAASPRRPVRFFVLVSLYDLRWRDDGRRLREALVAREYPLTYIEIPEGHTPNAYRGRIDEILAVFFPPDDEASR